MDIFDWYRKIIAGKRGVVFEFGCNDGYHTSILSGIAGNLCTGYRYFALEPDHRVFPCLHDRVKDNPSITLIQAAVHSAGGMHEFYLSSGTGDDGSVYSGSSSLLKPGGVTRVWPRMRFDSVATVQCFTYDELFDNAGVDMVDFIWADIQGAEINLILGGQKALKKTRYLYAEYSNGGLYEGDAPLDNLLAALPEGWEIAEDFKGDVLFGNTGTGSW
ncbi:MAG: FkbM family methyltransferase [Pseudomonadota bacterium]